MIHKGINIKNRGYIIIWRSSYNNSLLNNKFWICVYTLQDVAKKYTRNINQNSLFLTSYIFGTKKKWPEGMELTEIVTYVCVVQCSTIIIIVLFIRSIHSNSIHQSFWSSSWNWEWDYERLYKRQFKGLLFYFTQ